MRGGLWLATAGLSLLALGAVGRGAEEAGPAAGLLGSWVSMNILALVDEELQEFVSADEDLYFLRFDPDGRWWIFESDVSGLECRHVELDFQADSDSLRQPGNPERRLAFLLDGAGDKLELTDRQGVTRSFLRLDEAMDTTNCPRDPLILLHW